MVLAYDVPGHSIVLATGAHQKDLKMPGGDLPGVYDFATMVEDLDYEPKRCVIVGGGKVAVEYGAFFQAAGIQTTVLTRSPLLRTKSLHHVDEDIRRYLVDGMRKRGMEIIEGALTLEIKGGDRAERVIASGPDGESLEFECDFVFDGTGERPNSAMATE